MIILWNKNFEIILCLSHQSRIFFFFFFFALIYFIYPFAIKKKESREGEGSKPSIETMYSNFYIKILLYIYIVSI